ncbi:RNA 2'-phosphotransferase [Hymenobacter saemangeumensis]|uniref:Probable RNA 2'-phosphotransferase n=1 Tax=Hymenobacter saemangeumensis TaxID=1084522 RepID=A0ABP8HZ67_9BACT
MLSEAETTQISKYLSLVLRHKPEMIGLALDENGWTDVPTLLHALSRRQITLSLADLRHVVATNNKQRFAFNDDQTRIRANQGHSVEVALGYEEKQPPALLYHGTTVRYVGDILEEGLKKQSRHHVHLSADEATARTVGQRRGKPIVLGVKAAEMAAAGHSFYQSANGVWLTEHVPPAFIEPLPE